MNASGPSQILVVAFTASAKSKRVAANDEALSSSTYQSTQLNSGNPQAAESTIYCVVTLSDCYSVFGSAKLTAAPHSLQSIE